MKSDENQDQKRTSNTPIDRPIERPIERNPSSSIQSDHQETDALDTTLFEHYERRSLSTILEEQ